MLTEKFPYIPCSTTRTVRAQRESFRRYLTTVVQPLSRLLEAELRQKLEADVGLSFDGTVRARPTGPRHASRIRQPCRPRAARNRSNSLPAKETGRIGEGVVVSKRERGPASLRRVRPRTPPPLVGVGVGERFGCCAATTYGKKRPPRFIPNLPNSDRAVCACLLRRLHTLFFWRRINPQQPVRRRGRTPHRSSSAGIPGCPYTA